jgi:translation initiation factor IF-2
VPSKELIRYAADWGVKLSNHFTLLTKNQLETIKSRHDTAKKILTPHKDEQLSKAEMLVQIEATAKRRKDIKQEKTKKKEDKKKPKDTEDTGSDSRLTSEELVEQFRKIYKDDDHAIPLDGVDGKAKKKEIFTFDKSLTSNKGKKGKTKGAGNNSGHNNAKGDKNQGEELVEGAEVVPEVVENREVSLNMPITLKNLSAGIGIKLSEIISGLLKKGKMLNQNASLSSELAIEIAFDHGVILDVKEENDIEDDLKEMLSKKVTVKNLQSRPPVITLMGHVDHGKTSLLDKIRQSKKAGSEAGGITQHIAAYQVVTSHGPITFLDTPGHEAFTHMRARGANITDLVVLVVAADDGIMPQTVEAVNHAKAANVPIIVAINKMDLPGANIERVKAQLANLELTPEDWGGKTVCVPVSAMTGAGVNDLLEMLAMEGEMLELKADLNCTAHGIVLESKVDPGRGILCTIIVKEGSLRKGDVILCSHGYGKARFLYDHNGSPIPVATASVPVEVAGLSEVPEAGDTFYVMDSLSKAKDIADKRSAAQREQSHIQDKTSLHNLFQKIEAGKVSQIKVVLKTDVAGSLEVIDKLLQGCQTEEVKVVVVHKAVGAITENDVKLAAGSDAIVIGFHVIADPRIKAVAEKFGVDLRIYNVIYHLKDDILDALEGALGFDSREVITGHVEIRSVFKSSKIGNIAGCYVLDGKVQRSNEVRVTREGTVVYQGKLGSLKRFNDDAREVREKFECGIVIANYDQIKEGDILETYYFEQVKRKLDRDQIGKKKIPEPTATES